MSFLKIFKDRKFQNTLLVISLPIALQNLVTYCTGMMDTVMLGQLGEIQLSAATVANQLGNIFLGLTFGITSGANILLSQYWGKRDLDAIRSITAVMYWVSLFTSILFFGVAFLFPQNVMRVFTNDPEVIAAGAGYLQLVCWTYLCMGVGNAMLMSLRAVGTVGISLVVYSISFVVNTSLNWVFIFGNLGVPAMGMEGAAIATIIARGVEVAIAAFYVFRLERKICLRPHHLFRFDRSYLRDFGKNVLPVMANELIWSSGNSTLLMIMGRMGRAFVTATSITSITMQFAQIFATGLSNAIAVVIGNTIGEGDHERAQSIAQGAAVIGVGLGVFAGVVIYTIRPLIVGFYNIPPATRDITMAVMGAASIVAFFNCIAIMEVGGVIRGGGDIRFMLFADSVLMWMVSIPLGALAGLVFGLPPTLVYLILKSDDAIKILLCSYRIAGKRWIKQLTR